MDLHDIGVSDNAGHGRNVIDEIEIKLEKCRVDSVPVADQKECVAVWRGTRRDFRCDIAAGARPVLDDKRLA
jgi:hypothetical protein